jgi:cytochrome P450
MILNPLRRQVKHRLGFPVMPGAFPVIGHLPAVATNYLELVRTAEARLGSFFWLESALGATQLTCLDPDVFTIFKNKVTTSTYLQTLFAELFGGSLIAQDGPPHHHMRSAMNLPFLPRGLTASEVGPMVAETIERRVASWPARGHVQILAETREMVLAVMFRLLGVAETELSAWRHHYEEFMLLAVNIPFDLPYSPRRRGLRARAWLDERLLKFIRTARANPEGSGLLTALVQARDEDGEPLTERELVENLRLLVLAGHETSASTMAWMTIKLAQRPDVWDKLCAEVATVGAAPRTPKELRNFPYAEAIFREALRLHPPVCSDARKTVAALDIGGRTIPAGEIVTISIMHLSRHPSLYERPDEFRPERWIGRNEAVSPIELVQFGGGPHFCLGYHLAWMEIVQYIVALATVLRKRNLSPQLTGPPPAERYLPLHHPAPSTRIRFG